MVVHFVVALEAPIHPLCGTWAGSPSWTRVRSSVTCPVCRELLEAALVWDGGQGALMATMER